MATRTQDISRFFLNYQKLIILIGIVFTIQIFFAVRLVLYQGGWDTSGDGVKGPYKEVFQGSQRNVKEGQVGNPPVKPDIIVNELNNVVKNNSSPLALDLESLGFVPECNITLRDSVSAINRAKTQSCKEQIASLSCDIISDNVYAKRLPRFCRNTVTKYGRHVGCFKDNPRDRILSGHISVFKDKNSLQICLDLCLQSGFQYAGLQYGVECFCGHSNPSSNIQIDQEMCNIKCPNNDLGNNISPDDIQSWAGNCGGYFAMDVFETGIFQEYELNNQVIGLDGRKTNGELAKKPEKTVRIVFFLTLNGRCVRQVFRLIKALFQEKHFFYIHVDSRQDYLYRELLMLRNVIPNNVRFMSSRKATIWGGASLLTVLLDGMDDLIKNAEEWKWDWDYVINLSESDFPLKTTEQLETFLSHNRGRNFVKSHGRDVQKFIQKQGLDKTFFECEHRMWRVADRKLPMGVMIDGGSDWIALHRNFVDYIVKTDDELVAGLRTVFRYTLLPAESFFHTVLRNSIHCPTFVDNNLHVTNWKRKLGCKCQYRNVVDWCGCSPNDFRLSDWNRLTLAESKIIFFGRKFESIVNQGIINKLESWLYPDRFETHYPTMDRFWLSLYHHHDLSPKADDALVTLGRSLARIAATQFAGKYNCTLLTKSNYENDHYYESDAVHLIEILTYNHDDEFQGILIRLNCSVLKQVGFEGNSEVYTISLETWFQLQHHVQIAPWSKSIARYRSKIQDIEVGTDYEQKEQIYRNFARSIGPFSEPVLTYNFISDELFNITAVFVDPSSNVQAVTNGSGAEGASGTTNFVKPSLKTPMEPGNWTIKVLSIDGYLLAEAKILVLPLEIHNGRQISRKNSLVINRKSFSSQSFVDYDTNEGEERYIEELRDWIDSLVSEFYTIQDFCLEIEHNHQLLSKWKSEDITNANGSQGQSDKLSRHQDGVDITKTSICSHTQWSSLFPDPKSTIEGIDPTLGLLLP